MVFFVGVLMTLARRKNILVVLGTIISFKASVFVASILSIQFFEQPKMLSELVLSGVYFALLFCIVGIALLIRGRRVEGGNDFDAMNRLKH